MNAGPTISVIVPTYNRRQFVLEAIESVRSQRYPAIEIIVVDDGSTDGTCEELARMPDITLIAQQNEGPSSARNTGLEQATGALLTFLDSDDLWPEGRLNKTVNALDATTDSVMGHILPIGLDGKPMGDARTGAYLGSGLYRREIYDAIGGFDVDRSSWEDLDWLNRAREAGFVAKIIDEVTLLYRTHESNMSADVDVSRQGLLDVIRESLTRRREAGKHLDE